MANKNYGADVYDVIQTINQIVHQFGYDGATNEKGEPVEIGLSREEGHPILDKRVMDGFKVRFQGNLMLLCYSTETILKKVYEGKFEEELTDRIEDIVSFIKKEYRKAKKETLKLKMIDEPKILVQHISNYRTWADARCIYEIGNFEEMEISGVAEEKMKKAMKKWLEEKE